ncbi:hypothetical protein ACTXT7_014908 [Hymenolepis weldensis]
MSIHVESPVVLAELDETHSTFACSIKTEPGNTVGIDLILTAKFDRARLRNPLPKLMMFLMANGMHQPFANFKCEICTKSFSRASYLRKHVLGVHKTKIITIISEEADENL